MRKRNRNPCVNSSLSNQSEVQQWTFLTYQEEILELKQKKIQNKEALHRMEQANYQKQQMEFTQEQREHLKNAFRYICRLAFKESHRYIFKLKSLYSQKREVQLSDSDFKNKFLGLLKDAEMISGQRYFKQYLQNIDRQDQELIINYMIWFLENKYLRYLKRNQCEKGKRKNMKKDLYLRFKNQIMIPYLYNSLKSLQTNN